MESMVLLFDRAEDIIRWDGVTGRDRWGTYHIITGHEGSGGCFWCGKDLKSSRRFCGHRSGHWTLYAQHFYWSYARVWCCQRQQGICANCGWHSTFNDFNSLEVHHIIPLNGEQRQATPFNLPWNLIGLCHKCHQEIHTVMREASKPIPLDVFELALTRGQSVFDIVWV